MRSKIKIPMVRPGRLSLSGACLWLMMIFWMPACSGNEGALPEAQQLKLQIERTKFKKLESYRETALARGMLTNAEKDWKKAQLILPDTSLDIKMRLKGDWTDHLQSRKWSFRVRIKHGAAWHRMSEFSLQNPSTRSDLKEWLFHKVLAYEQVLSPRYDFVQLQLNGDDWGLYAIEEHFSKELVESQGRREGPIMKVDESGLWELRAAFPKEDLPWEMLKPIYESAASVPFDEKRWMRDSASQAVLQHALLLMQQYREASRPPSEIFDLAVMARRYALTDLFGAHHSLIWHNRRFYYNPISSRLEPVVFDGFAGPNAPPLLNGPFTGYGCNGNTRYGGQADLLGTIFFKDEGFLRSYYGLLALYSQHNYIDKFLALFEEEWKAHERHLQKERWGYSFETDFLYENATTIQNALHQPLGKDVLLARSESSGEKDCFCLENRSGLALELKAADGPNPILDAHDGQGDAPWRMLCLPEGEKPQYRVLGQVKWLPWPMD